MYQAGDTFVGIGAWDGVIITIVAADDDDGMMATTNRNDNNYELAIVDLAIAQGLLKPTA